MTDNENLTKYELNEMTDITQYNVEDVYKDWSETEKAFGNPKTYIPVFHWLQPKPGEGWEPVKIELYEWHVEIGWPTLEPWDTEEYDDEILAQSWRERDIHPDAISISPVGWNVVLKKPNNTTLDLTATVKPASSEFPISWSASPSGKVKITETSTPGKVTIEPLVETESVAVTATSWAVRDTVNVVVQQVHVNSVSITEESISLVEWWEQTLTLTVSPIDAYNPDVTWSSSNSEVASVDQNGKVTAIAAGENVTITVTSNDDNTKTDTCTVTVTAPVVEEPETPTETPTEPGE